MRNFVDRKWPQVGHFEFDQVENFHGISLPETTHFVQIFVTTPGTNQGHIMWYSIVRSSYLAWFSSYYAY